MNVRIKEVKADFSDLYFPDAKSCNDGSMGRAIEQSLVKQGFNVSNGVIDLPDYQLEVKTRKSSSKSPHTVGTMTHDDILNTPWEQTSFKQKLQNQFRVTINVDSGLVSNQDVIHLEDDEDIQKELRASYESAQKKLLDYYTKTGEILQESYIKGEDGEAFLEYKEGSSYAFRITDSGMKRYINMSKNVGPLNDFFELNDDK